MSQRDLFDDVVVESVRKVVSAQEERDQALALLERTRSRLITAARLIAERIWRSRGRVTSVEVFAEMRAQGFGAQIDAVDGRWMGAVFARGLGWKRTGYEPTGSHARPVAIWTRS